MARKVIGPTGSRRRRWLFLCTSIAAIAMAVFFIPSAFAVHDASVFQLDGDASTALQSSPTALEDADLICKANRVQVGTLNATITISQTTIAVNETQSLPGATLPINIQIGGEQMTVTARTGASNPRTYTVTRHIDGTTAAVAASGAAVFSGCLFQHGYTPPAGSTLATPSKFIVDQSNNQVDDILKTGTKDDNDIPSWSWTTAGSLDKNDLTNGYAAEYTCKGTETNSVPGCQGNTGDKLLYFGTDRYGISGSANVGFWLFQHRVVEQSNTGAPAGQCSISSGCPFTDQSGNAVTHKVGNVSLGGSQGTGCSPAQLAAHPSNVCTPGDILVIGAFGPHNSLNVYEWVGAGNATKNYNGTNSCFTAACSLQPLYTAADGTCGTPGAGNNDNACAVANTTVTASPWILPQKNIQGKAVGDQFNADTVHGLSTYIEGGINLTGLGVGGACFSSFLINSRSSASGDSELHDKLLGSFQRCSPSLSTQQSVAANQDGTPGTVQPGTAVTDTATVAVAGATSPDDATGTIDFTLCGPLASIPASGNLCDASGVGTVSAGTAKALGNSANCNPASSSTTDGVSCAFSDSVNGTGHELANGYYCFKATASLTNYDNPDPATNNTTECFQVLKLPTTIATDPQTCTAATPPVCTTNTGPLSLSDTAFSVYDHAVVTGSAAGGFPEGSVTFYICAPSEVSGGVCASGAGNKVGNDKTLSHVVNQTFKSEATSDGYSISSTSALGVYCWRADYTSTSSVYNDVSDASTTSECFTVQNSSSASSTQDWLPNDHATITAGAGSVAGTLSIQLVKGTLGATCAASTGTVKYTEPVPNSGAFTASSSGTTYDTTNATFKVAAADAGDYYWRIIFTPTSSFATGVTKCETSSVSINNNP